MKKLNFIGMTAGLTGLLTTSGQEAFAQGGSIPGSGIAVTAIIMPFLAIGIIVFLGLYFNSRNKCEKYRLLTKAIEQGKDIPPHFFEEAKNKRRMSKLESAFTLIGCGIGIALFGILAPKMIPLAIPAASIPVLIGIGQLLARYIEKKQAQTGNNE